MEGSEKGKGQAQPGRANASPKAEATLPRDSLLGTANLSFAEALYEDFLREPSSVPKDWQEYFVEFADGDLRYPKPRFGPSFRPGSLFNPRGVSRPSTQLPDRKAAALQDRVYLLIRLYR